VTRGAADARGAQASTSLVTGGAGFLGAHVTSELLRRGHSVVVLDDLSGGFEANVPEGAKFVKGSVTDARLVAEVFERHPIDYVFHLAAYAAEGLSHFIKRFNYANNVLGSVTLINEAIEHRVRCFVFTSSIAVYGPEQTPMTEATAPQPEDPYGIAKMAVEQDLRATLRMFGLNHIIFRPHNVYGEQQNIGDRYRNVVGIFMNQLMRGEALTVFGDGEQVRAFSYVSDVAPYIAQSVDVPEAYNEVFNVGADLPVTLNELAEKVMEAMQMETPIRHLAPRQEVVNAFADHQKARRVFNMRPPVPLPEGLGRMAAWAKEVGPRQRSEFSAIEVTRGLPEVWRES